MLLVPPGVTPRRQETTNRLAVLAHSFDLNEGDSLDAATYLELLYHYSETRRGWSAYSEMREEMDARGWLDVLGGAAEDGPEAWEWNRLNAQYDPVGDWDDVRVPVLAVFGTEDLNVIPTVNVPPLRAALAASGNRDVTTLVEPGVDHSLRYGGLSIPLHRRVGYGKGVWALIFRWLQRWSG